MMTRMLRNSGPDGIEAAPRWIMTLVGAYLIMGMFALYLWNSAGQFFTIQAASQTSSGSTSAVALTGLAAAGLWLSLVVFRSFPAGAPLRATWLLLAVAAGLQMSSGLLAGLPGPGAPTAAMIAGGPLKMAVLAAGILGVLRVMGRFGFRGPAKRADWAVFGIGVLFALCRLGETAVAIRAGRPVDGETWASLAGLPFLCALLLEAMLLRRSVVCMGSGLIGRCWTALVAGILLTAVGEVALWAIPHYSQTLPLSVCEALIRLPIAAAFALVPAYQVAAQRRAMKPQGTQPQNATARPVPALAE